MTARRVLVFLGLLSSLVFLGFTGAHLNLSRVARALESARWWPWLPLALLSYLCGHFVRGWRLRRLVSREATLTVPTATQVVVVGYAVNNLLPARLGELARAWMLMERSGLHFTQSLTVTVIERLLDGLVLLAFLGIASVAIPGPALTPAMVWIVAVLFAVAALALALVVVAPGWPLSLTSRLSRRLAPRFHDTMITQVGAVTSAAAYLRRPGHALVVVALGVLVWLLEAGLFLFLLPAFALPFSPTTALLAMSVTNLGILLPSSPGFVGAFHFFCMTAVASTGAARDVAAGYAVLVHLTFYVPITLWGLGVLIAHGLSVGRAVSLTREARPMERLPSALGGVGAPLPERGPVVVDPVPTRFVRALAEASVPIDEDGLEGAEREGVLDEVAGFLQGQLDALPPRLRTLFALGALGFRGVTRLVRLRSFAALPCSERRRWFEHWAYGPLTPARQLFRGVRSTALLAYYERPEVRRKVDLRARAITSGRGAT